MDTPHSEAAYHRRDPRDATGVDFDAINAKPAYVLYAVFRTARPLPAGDAERGALVDELEQALAATGVTVRGYYDVAGLRSDADLLCWFIHETPEAVQAAYHAVCTSALGRHLDRVWSCLGVHRPSEFNQRHVPSCLRGIHPREWLCVYPFVRSFEWYLLPEADRERMLREHGAGGMQYPDVKASTIPTFALSDYEWILAFEADELHRLSDMMRHQRSMEARSHVRVEVPFYTGRRLELGAWADRQPHATTPGGAEA